MAETYSVALQGFLADDTMSTNKPNYTIPDKVAQRPAGRHQAMRLGQQILVLQPDGSQAWMTLDAERSTNDNPVLRRV